MRICARSGTSGECDDPLLQGLPSLCYNSAFFMFLGGLVVLARKSRSPL